MMTIRNAKTKAAILVIDDEGNMNFFDENGQPGPRTIKVDVIDEEDTDAPRDANEV